MEDKEKKASVIFLIGAMSITESGLFQEKDAAKFFYQQPDFSEPNYRIENSIRYVVVDASGGTAVAIATQGDIIKEAQERYLI